jgi:CRP-like cAMP-binding protein
MTEAAEIERHPFLADVPAEQIRTLAPRAVTCEPGAFIFREGDEADTLYLLCSGRVTLELNIPGRGPTQLESLGADDILGLSWLFAPYRWHLDARVVEPVQALALDAAALRARMAEDPVLGNRLATRLLRYLYDRLERVRLQRLDVYKAEP